MSRSGVLLRGQVALEPDTPIEVVVDLPAALANEPAARLTGRGRVVRAETDADSAEGHILAAEISSYRFVRTRSH